MSQDLHDYYAGSTEPWAVSVLQALVRLRKPLNLLELGTFEARTTRALADVMDSNAFLWTVDIKRRFEGDLPYNVKFYETDAIHFLETTCPPGSVQFAFVDDDHTKSHVRREVELLVDRCMWKPGGLIVLHDVIGPFGLDEIVEDFGGFIVDLPLLHAAGGLGVIEV